VPVQAHSLPLLRKLSRLLHDVPQKPSSEPVHRLRTTIRRVEAVLDALPSENHDKLRRQLRDLRRLAGCVRDLDVQQYLLRGVRAEGHGEQKEAVALKLAARRTKREKKLLSQLDPASVEGLRKRLRRLSAELRQLRDDAQTPALQDPVGIALEQFANLSSEIESLTPESLHDFRTRSKRIRYLAEMGCDLPDGELIVRELKRLQDAVGVWHDWSELLLLAEKVLAAKPHAMLLGVLRTTVASHYNLALRTVREVRESLNAVRAARRKRAPRTARSSSAETKSAAG
jgi:CHAD domain-containing protein